MPPKLRGLSQLLGMQGSLGELNRALADRIASGEVDLQTPGLADHLWQTTMDKLAVDQPNYASYKRELGESVAASPHVIAADAPCRRRPGIQISDRNCAPWFDASHRPGMTRDGRYFPSHFGGRFSENAFGPSM